MSTLDSVVAAQMPKALELYLNCLGSGMVEGVLGITGIPCGAGREPDRQRRNLA